MHQINDGVTELHMPILLELLVLISQLTRFLLIIFFFFFQLSILVKNFPSCDELW